MSLLAGCQYWAAMIAEPQPGEYRHGFRTKNCLFPETNTLSCSLRKVLFLSAQLVRAIRPGFFFSLTLEFFALGVNWSTHREDDCMPLLPSELR